MSWGNTTRALLGVVLISIALGAGSVHAQTDKYVTDRLSITLRTGQGNEYQILRMVPSGTAVKVIEESSKGYSRVRLKGGAEGWVLTRYLDDSPIPRERLTRAERRMEELNLDNTRLRKSLNTLEAHKADMENRLKTLNEDRNNIQRKLTDLERLAAKPRELEEKNRVLREQVVGLESEAQILRQQNAALKDGSDRYWFLTGAGVLLGGMFLGIVLPRIRWRKKSSWDTF